MQQNSFHWWCGLITCLMVIFLGTTSTSALQPSSIPSKEDVRIMVISDLNSAYGSTEYTPEVSRALDLVPLWQPDLVLCGGDMVAGQKPSLTVAEIKAMWNAFDEKIAQRFRTMEMPFGFTIGNHDASSAVAFDKSKFLFQKERDLALEYWQQHQDDVRVNFVDRFEFPFYYTFALKDIFFLVWDSSSSRIPAEKLAWVEKSLNSPEAQKAKMKIVIGHLPLYAVTIDRDLPGEVLNNADQLREMLEKYQVHTYISGHHHAYYPAHKGNLQMLHAGILGEGARSLLSGNVPPMRNVTLIDIDFQNPALTTYTTYNMKDLTTVKLADLPPFLDSHNGRIFRRDVPSN